MEKKKRVFFMGKGFKQSSGVRVEGVVAFPRVVPWWVLSLESLGGKPCFELAGPGHKGGAALFQENGGLALGCRLLQLQFPTVSESHELLKDL